MKQALAKVITEVVKTMGGEASIVVVEVPEDAQFGEYTTNIAMQLAKPLKKSPMTIALQVKEELAGIKKSLESDTPDQSASKHSQNISAGKVDFNVLQDIERIEVVAPGFINIYLTEASLITQAGLLLKRQQRVSTPHMKHSLGALSEDNTHLEVKKVMVEFAHPNTHKAFHIGHLRNITTGETIVRLLQAVGYDVVRVNYQGDVGMHIAKCLYGILHGTGDKLQETRLLSASEKADFLGKAYAAGSKAYEEDETAKAEIGKINKQIYAKDPQVYSLYEETRQWSLDYFANIYTRVGTHYDRYYFESEVFDAGKEIVAEGLEKGIFERSESAIIFPGEKFGLHNRVFVTGEGNPTYEGKEMGLGRLQFAEHSPDVVLHVVAPEQSGYFQVVFEALAQMLPETKGREYHLVYGWVKLKEGKMSSRSGNVVLGEWLIDEAKKSVYTILSKTIHNYTKEEQESIAEHTAIAAVKYSFLKVATKSEIAFDFTESVTLEGDSGPYLLYTYARCKSVLGKANQSSVLSYQLSDISSSVISHSVSDKPTTDRPDSENRKQTTDNGIRLNPEEHTLARLLTQFDDVVASAASEFAPNTLCTYLFDLAQAFNSFYARHHILGDSSLELRDSGLVAGGKSEVSGVTKLETRNSKLALRLSLTAATAQVLHHGLNLLGIETIERM